MGILAGLAPASGAPAAVEPGFHGPLRRFPLNPRYFTDRSGRAIYLTGAHTWNNIVDMGPSDPPPAFDFNTHLEFLVRHHHNFTRLWTWESSTWNTEGNQEKQLHHAQPQPWPRTGPGLARDGKPRWDLSRFDPDYFQRLQTRVAAASRRGLYVSVMLFEGWAMQHSPGAWDGHPFHPANNINQINGDPNQDGRGLEVHTLTVPAITRLQETYVRHTLGLLNPFDNVLYEISNENHPASTDWQYHLIRFIHNHERTLPKQHPVGMTFQYRGGNNQTLFQSPADWISPNPEGGYRDDPPAADGRKVILNDTDHLWGIGGNVEWVWKSFLRGHHPIFMDPYDGAILGSGKDPNWKAVRLNLGHTLRIAQRVQLAQLIPRPDLASTRYCLAGGLDGHWAALAYLPNTRQLVLNTSEAEGQLEYQWLDTRDGQLTTGPALKAGHEHTLESPHPTSSTLLVQSTRSASGTRAQ
jgi:hypothetical protein